MHFNLRVLNLLHSLCDPSSDTPDFFRQNKYNIIAVEPQIQMAGGRTCNPECILVSAPLKNAIVVESKSGTGNSADQIGRYDALAINDLLGAGLGLQKGDLQTVDVSLFCDRNDTARQIEQLKALRSRMSVISYGLEGGVLKLEWGGLSDQQLQKAVRRGIDIPWPPTPFDYIPFDANSSDLEIATVIAPTISAIAQRRRKSFTSYDVCQESIRYWEVLQPKHKTALSTRIEKIVETLLSIGYSGHFKLSEKKGRLVVELTPNALRAALHEPGVFARRLLNMQLKALAEMQNKLAEEKQERQQSLFEGVVLPPVARHKRHRKSDF